MTAHTCRTITPGCYRCELARDEACEHVNSHSIAWSDFPEWAGWRQCDDCGCKYR